MLSSFLAFGLLIGSFFDYPIAKSTFHKTSQLGTFFAAYGQVPAMASLSFAGILLIYARPKAQIKALLSGGIGVGLLGMGFLMTTLEAAKYLPSTPVYLLVGYTFIMYLIVDGLLFFFVKDASKEELIKFAFVIVFIVFAQMFIITVLKMLWGRPRMRLLNENATVSFQNWWVIGSPLKQQLISSGVASSEFKSFPSSHTASAACLFILCILPRLNHRLVGKQNYLFYFATIGTMIVAISRVVIGAHFLSDVVIGFSITFAIVLITINSIYKNQIT